MSTYCFVLGKDPELSLAELYAVFPDALFSSISRDFILMETTEKIDQKKFNRLGGVLKMAQIEAQVEKQALNEAILEVLLVDYQSGKLNYGVSVYGMPERQLKTTLIGLKKLLQSAKISSRFANQNFLNLSIAQKKGLKGPEVLVAQSGSQFFVGQVIATQDIDAYSKRDYQKPFRDMRVGMLPPKLAQILINLTGSKGPVWDPFCGGGVLLMEGLLMGYSMLGSDIEPKTLTGAKKNVEWIKKTFQLDSEVDLFLHDATDPVPRKAIDAIAFEGYLGPPQTKLKSERELRPFIAQLDELYLSFFSTLKRARFKGAVVAALPFFKILHQKEVHLGCLGAIQSMGFELDSLLPHVKKSSLKYARSNQLVGREIFRLYNKGASGT